jgi:hypothetical protein
MGRVELIAGTCERCSDSVFETDTAFSLTEGTPGMWTIRRVYLCNKCAVSFAFYESKRQPENFRKWLKDKSEND